MMKYPSPADIAEMKARGYDPVTIAEAVKQSIMMKYPSPADIAEMKARGYDPVTVAEAEKQSNRWTRAQEICEMIRKAFAGVTLGNGVGLREAQGLDDYEDEATCAKYRSGDEKEDWQLIPIEALNRCNSSLSFFDAEGMRFHLPAYLIADLHGDYGFGHGVLPYPFERA